MNTKIIPVKLKDIFLAKLIIPTTLSFFSLLITELTLLISRNIDATVFFVSLFIGAILIIFTSYFGLYFDMYDKGSLKHNYSAILESLNVIYPFLLLALHFYMSYIKVNGSLIYLTECAISLVLLLPILLINKKKLELAFKKMEVN